ncbi:MAG: hypothetical protein PHE17_10930 [Thiothrix sp.]|uniref:hypothetical protein n=1 Tax=Thiothrix sp. TaxID=1032 RepID=UPI00262DBA69|nr:hypothetical protein [Thiothrix sp.]MDD5393520.1 hypothetical protein [Thiothrix sp.]
MNTPQITPMENQHNATGLEQYTCTPCHAKQEKYGDTPYLAMNLWFQPETTDHDRHLLLELRNLRHDWQLHHVKIAFITPDPNPYLEDGSPAMVFSPGNGIPLADMDGQNDAQCTMQKITFHNRLAEANNVQFYAGVCFEASHIRRPLEVQSGYVLFKSGLPCSAGHSE